MVEHQLSVRQTEALIKALQKGEKPPKEPDGRPDLALYLGEGKYIHSTARNGSDGVVINSLNPGDPDYREDLDKGMTAAGSIF